MDESKATVNDTIISCVLIALGIFLILALQTQTCGVAGEGISKVLKGCFGFVAFFLPYYFIIYGVLLFLKKTIHTSLKSIIYLVVIYLVIDLINAGRFMKPISNGGDFEGISKAFTDGINLDGGGVFGMGIGTLIVKAIGISGLYILSFLVLIIFIMLLVNTPLSRFFENFKLRRRRRQIEREELAKARAEEEAATAAAAAEAAKRPAPMSNGQKKVMGYIEDGEPDAVKKERIKVKTAEEDPVQQMSNAEAKAQKLKEEDFIRTTTNENYEFPPIDLLKRSRANVTGETPQTLQDKAMKLENTLRSFNIDAAVTNVTQGPAVTRYEVHPNSGVRVKGIKNLADDIALNMEAKSIRIEAPIPGKQAVGIEIENEKRSDVSIREMIASDTFQHFNSKLAFVVGKDIGGKVIVADLKKMPHLLIAGSTGSGKSVCINSIIASLFYKARPDEVKMVLIDPKVVELSHYNGIPHLLIPVVTDASRAAAALNWAVTEMDERYKTFAEAGARDVTAYNEMIEKRNQKALMAGGRKRKTDEGG